MKNYLDNLISESKIKLQLNNKDNSAYKALIEGTYCSLLLFNKRRVGELQRILLDTYVKHQDTKPSGEFERLLSPSEKILIKSLKRIVIRGKRGRGVPVLIDKVTQEGIDLILEHRNNFFATYNPYLFGRCNSESCISGYHVFRNHVSRALGDSKKTQSLTSTKLRKYLATISQILKMKNEDLEQLATFMGHTTKTHNEWYRLPSDIYQTAKVSKILLLAQNNSIEQYKGRNLDELEIGDEILENLDGSEDEIEAEQMETTSSTETKSSSIPVTETNKKKKIIIKKAWTKTEKKVTESFFRDHIRNKNPPKKQEVLDFMEKHPELKTRKWETIKAYVCNQYAKK